MNPEGRAAIRSRQNIIIKALEDVWICSYSVIALVLLLVVLPTQTQTTEIAHALFGHVEDTQSISGSLFADAQAKPAAIASSIFVFISMAYCTLCIWLAASACLRNHHARRTATKTVPLPIASAIPLWLAFLVVLSPIGMIVGADTGVWLGVAAIGLGIVALVIFPYDFRKKSDFERARHGTLNAKKPKYRALRPLRRVHRYLSKSWLPFEIACDVVGILLLIATLIWRTVVPHFLTTWVLLYLAIGFWTLLASRAFIAFPRRLGFPSMWLLPIVWAICLSSVNDNHEIVAAHGTVYGPPVKTSQPAGFHESLVAWKARQPGGCAVNTHCLLRIVAVEGGGLRAAYWANVILEDVTAKNSLFAQSIFAFSTVSGGSLGTVAFYAGMNAHESDGAACEHGAFTRHFLSDDHLAPVIGSLVFGNAIQWLWPWVIPGLDRGDVFDENMSWLWSKHLRDAACVMAGVPDNGYTFFDGPLTQLSKLPSPAPALFMNATNVESGKRVIISTVARPASVPVASCASPDPKERDAIGVDTYWALDPCNTLHMSSIAVKTAARLSSSFPVVTPAGTLYEHDLNGKRGALWGRLVDGGYFDGTGLMTALDLYQAIRSDPANGNIRIQIIFISDDPSPEASQRNTRAGIPLAPEPPATLLAKSPVDAVASKPPALPFGGGGVKAIIDATVNAHWEDQINASRRFALSMDPIAYDNEAETCTSLITKSATPSADGFCEISLSLVLADTTQERPALGWWLSKTSTEDMDNLGSCYVDHIAAMLSEKNTCNPIPTPAPSALFGGEPK